MISIKVDISDSLLEKLDSRKLQDACSNTVKDTTKQLQKECEDECPVRSGRLKDGHYSKIVDLEGNVCNDVEYAPFVIYGTSRQAPNNYPQRAMGKVSMDTVVTTFKKYYLG